MPGEKPEEEADSEDEACYEKKGVGGIWCWYLKVAVAVAVVVVVGVGGVVVVVVVVVSLPAASVRISLVLGSTGRVVL